MKMKKTLRMLLALALAIGLLLGEAAPAIAAFGTENSAMADVLARSKKKKATPTPAAAETPTPAPANGDAITPTPVPEGPITDPQSIADYLFAHDGELPDNFITKKEAQALGWDSSRNYVGDVAPGKSIGGDRFGNYEGILPTGKGITYKEADCYYTGKKRTAQRVVYSSDERVWYTADHYQTFTELFPTVP